MDIMGKGQHTLQYDRLPDQHFRLFRLELNSPSGRLSGQLLSCYLSGPLDLTKKGIWKDFFGDTIQIMKMLSGSSGYDAVSYAWGFSSSKHPLWISNIRDSLVAEGVDVNYEPARSGPIYINYTLYALLQELLRRKHRKFLWIDVICIN